MAKRNPRPTRALWFALAGLAASVTVAASVPLVTAAEPQRAAPGTPTASESPVSVTAERETRDEFEDDTGGSTDADADDPAIWISPDDSDTSLVLGTLKNAGLSVFDLKGKELQRVAPPPAPGPDDEPGRFNNVEVLHDVEIGDEETDIAVVTDRGRDQLRVFAISQEGADAKTPLTDITSPDAPFLFSKNQAEVNKGFNAYGLSAWEEDDEMLALVSREHTPTVGLVRLTEGPGGTVGYELVRTADMPTEFDLPDGSTFTPCEEPGEAPQQEGMLVDAEEGVAYIAQEQVGLWRVDATLKEFEPELVDKAKEFGIPSTFDPETEECEVSGPDPGFGGKNLSIDVEGVTLYDRDDDSGYLIVSSQGDASYAVYEREGDNRYLGSFRIGDSAEGVDGTSSTDGLTVTNVPVGDFDKGLLVVQDGENTPEADGETRESTNFKFARWEKVAGAFDPPLDVDTDGFEPRD